MNQSKLKENSRSWRQARENVHVRAGHAWFWFCFLDDKKKEFFKASRAAKQCKTNLNSFQYAEENCSIDDSYVLFQATSIITSNCNNNGNDQKLSTRLVWSLF